MKQEILFYIDGSHTPRPESTRTIYVDGTASHEFRAGMDVELSHWMPNRTEAQYKAGTTTEICFKFLQNPHHPPYDLVINNHLDMDGLLSVFVLTHPDIALSHQKILCDAAAIGDFWAWAQGKALYLFQELSHYFETLRSLDLDKQVSYQRCFSLVLKILKAPDVDCAASSILEHQISLVRQGYIHRSPLTDRLTCYYVPHEVSQNHVKKYLEIANFNEPISQRIALWPQVRNYLDQEKIHLVSIQDQEGIHYDLWYPGYSWADTQGLWRPYGLIPALSTEDLHILDWPELTKLVKDLNEMESGPCHWQLFPGLNLGNKSNPRKFPVVLSTMNDRGEKEPSHIPLERVQEVFMKILP